MLLMPLSRIRMLSSHPSFQLISVIVWNGQRRRRGRRRDYRAIGMEFNSHVHTDLRRGREKTLCKGLCRINRSLGHEMLFDAASNRIARLLRAALRRRM